jgi:hypothetical protein
MTRGDDFGPNRFNTLRERALTTAARDPYKRADEALSYLSLVQCASAQIAAYTSRWKSRSAA